MVVVDLTFRRNGAFSLPFGLHMGVVDLTFGHNDAFPLPFGLQQHVLDKPRSHTTTPKGDLSHLYNAKPSYKWLTCVDQEPSCLMHNRSRSPFHINILPCF